MAHLAISQPRSPSAVPAGEAASVMTRSASAEFAAKTRKRKGENDSSYPYCCYVPPRRGISEDHKIKCVRADHIGTSGTRSVSKLTPAQLARKRAHDREAQRATRARTKELIKKLEQELDELRSKQDCDQTVRNLIKRNEALEKELMALRESMGIQTGHSSASSNSRGVGAVDGFLSLLRPSVRLADLSSVDANNVALRNPDVPSKAPSFDHHSTDYPRTSEYGASSQLLCPTRNLWDAVLPVSVSSTVSSPSSSRNTDDYGYMPTSVPPPPSTVDHAACLPSIAIHVP